MTLDLFNNTTDYLASGPYSAEFKRLRSDIQTVGDELIAKLPSQFAKWDHSVQDASYLEALALNVNEKNLTEIRFSRYGRMVAITNEDLVPENLLKIVREILRSYGFNYISEAGLGEPFRLRDRMNGDWFHRFFDYI